MYDTDPFSKLIRAAPAHFRVSPGADLHLVVDGNVVHEYECPLDYGLEDRDIIYLTVANGVRSGGGPDSGGRGQGDLDTGGPDTGGADPGGSDPGGRDPGGPDPGGADRGGSDPGGSDPGGGDSGGADRGGANPGGIDACLIKTRAFAD